VCGWNTRWRISAAKEDHGAFCWREQNEQEREAVTGRKIVVADTTPLRYLVVIEREHLLPALYGRVLTPPAVAEELN
jgi:hypothetical protein